MPKTSGTTQRKHFKRLPKTASGAIELLLVQPVEHLGKQGDVVTVKPGYALNFLLPQGLATVATDHHKRMVEKHRSKLAEIENARLAGLRSLAEDLGRQSVTIEANANDEGHLYGSVGAPEIANALKRTKFNIAADQVRLKGPLKELGLYTVAIHLAAEIEGEVKVWVVPTVTPDEGAPSGGEAPAAG
ncbi:MAG: 50S ribosomal protein L9 [Thermoguttaceae bacterium]|jgi:large subunit ribosomal protein L9